MKKAFFLANSLCDAFYKVRKTKAIHTCREYHHSVIYAKIPTIQCVVISMLILSVSGCKSNEQRNLQGKATQITSQYSKEELRESLNQFDDFGSTVIAEASRQINEKEPNFRTRKMNLIQRTQLKQAFDTMLGQEDPIVALIETWTLCVRLEIYLKSGEGSDLFRKHQDIVITFSEKLKNEIEKIGRKFLQEDVFAQTQKNTYNFFNILFYAFYWIC